MNGPTKSEQLPTPPGAVVTPLPNLPPQNNAGPIVAAPHTVAEYATKFEAAKVRPQKLEELKTICARLLKNEDRYKEVETATGVRWDIVACIHERESSSNFETYLQNGDPLFSHSGVPLSTVHVPSGIGPFKPQNWVTAAVHALGGESAHKSAPRDLGSWLMWAEMYNGTGYKKRGQPSPYLWSFTDQYVSGKYVEDGVFDPRKVDDQAGVAAMLKVLGSV